MLSQVCHIFCCQILSSEFLLGLEEMTSLFESERDRAAKLQTTVHDLTEQSREASERLTQHANTEKALTDKTRDLVRAYMHMHHALWF